MSKRARAKRLTLRRDLADRMNREQLSEDIDRLMDAIKRGLQGHEPARAERREVESWAR